MSSAHSRSPNSGHDELPLDDLPARPVDGSETAAPMRGSLGAHAAARDDESDNEVIRIEDLAPRENVRGGRKIILGEVLTRPEEP